jgi:hypothetical protein
MFCIRQILEKKMQNLVSDIKREHRLKVSENRVLESIWTDEG